jgi:hypothetical protein
MTFGLNIIPMQRDRGQLFPTLARLKPRWCVVMDDFDLARSIRSAGYGVIYRQWTKDDHRLYDTLDVPNFIRAYAPFAVNGIVVQALNEPGVGTVEDAKRMAAWCEYLLMTAPPSMQLCLPNCSTGTPNETLIRAGVFDGLLRKLRDGDLLGLHEYVPKAGELSTPWHIGRYRFWLDRAKKIGSRKPAIVMTENGFDAGA